MTWQNFLLSFQQSGVSKRTERYAEVVNFPNSCRAAYSPPLCFVIFLFFIQPVQVYDNAIIKSVWAKYDMALKYQA